MEPLLPAPCRRPQRQPRETTHLSAKGQMRIRNQVLSFKRRTHTTGAAGEGGGGGAGAGSRGPTASGGVGTFMQGQDSGLSVLVGENHPPPVGYGRAFGGLGGCSLASSCGCCWCPTAEGCLAALPGTEGSPPHAEAGLPQD